MAIPTVALPIAFAVGVPIGLAGYFIQERSSRQRARANAEGAAAPAADGAAPAADGTAPAAETSPAPERRRAAASSTELHKREAYLDAALDALVDFVDGPPRPARAQVCAKRISDAVPRSRRSPLLTGFLADVDAVVAPSKLQDSAEEVGLELAAELKTVKRELRTLAT
jgi:hypothetical protein